jgi:peptidoglycan/LPS O-acetylase OafA/YrhL
MDTSLLVLTIGFLWILYSNHHGFGAVWCFTFSLFVMPLSGGILYFDILHDLRPIYVYKEWQYIDKNLIKKMALSSFSGLAGILVLMFGKPLILKKALGIFIILFVLNSLRVKKKSVLFKR